MKVLWIVLGVLFGLCLICGGGGYFLFMKGKGVFDEAGKFGDDSFRAIATNWDVKEFERVAAPEIAEQSGKEAIPNLMDRLSKQLGPLKGSFTSHVTSFKSQNNNGISATYADWNADATFEKGSGAVTMQLISRNGNWQVLKFDVQSTAIR